MNRLDKYGRLLLSHSRHLCFTSQSPVTLAYTHHQPATDKYGRDSPLLLLHGLFGSKSNWQILGKKMADRLNTRVLAIDMRNHGDSPHSSQMSHSLMADDVVALMDSLNIRNGHVLGHSMGGKAAMNLALRLPERLNSLIIEDVVPNQGAFSPEAILRYMDAMLKLDMNMNGQGLALFRQKAMKSLENDIPDIKVRAFLIQNLTKKDDNMAKWRCNVEALKGNWPDVSQGSTPESAQFTRPTCFIGGANSPYLQEGSFRAEDKAVIFKYFPQAECHVVPAAGHWVHSEQPDVFLDKVCTFLKTVL